MPDQPDQGTLQPGPCHCLETLYRDLTPTLVKVEPGRWVGAWRHTCGGVMLRNQYVPPPGKKGLDPDPQGLIGRPYTTPEPAPQWGQAWLGGVLVVAIVVVIGLSLYLIGWR